MIDLKELEAESKESSEDYLETLAPGVHYYASMVLTLITEYRRVVAALEACVRNHTLQDTPLIEYAERTLSETRKVIKDEA